MSLPQEIAEELPDELREQLEEEALAPLQQLEALGLAIADKRKEAVTARTASGIEEVWIKCEESYLGIDDMNRHEFAGAKWAKPVSMEGPVTTSRSAKDGDVRSTVFVPLTSRYVDAGAAKLGEILLPLDDKAFSFESTPVPELVKRQEDGATVVMPGSGQPVPAEAVGVQPEQPGQALKVKDLVAKEIEAAQESAKKAERRVYDWMVEAGHAAETRKVIHDSARIGVGILKGPFPDKRMSKALTRAADGVTLEIVEAVKPSEKWVDPWNLFPDPSCGEDIHSGDYILERDFLSPRSLKKLKRQPGYLKSQIDKVLKEGPGKCNVEGRNPNDPKGQDKHRYEVWYYYGTISRKDMEVAQAPGINEIPEGVDEVYAILTLVNDSVIRAVIHPLDSGDFPYHAFPWRRRAGHWAGVGVGEQLFVPQRMVNAGTRAMLNNAGKSSGSLIVFDDSCVVPADGSWTITPDKLFRKNPDATMDDVRKAFAVFNIPNATPQLMSIIEYAFRLAEESTSIPLVTQGQTGPTTPDTYGAAQLQNNNANTLLRAIAYVFDDSITVRLVDQYYEWLLLDPTVPEDEKGDFNIHAHGSIALVERAIHDQTLAQAVGMSLNPAFGVDPRKVMEEFLKSKRINPREVKFTEEELAAQAKQPPPVAPQVQAAQINAQARLQVAQLDAQSEAQRVAADTDRDRVYVQAETQRTENEHQARMAELGLRRELAMLDYANKRELTLDQVKADLARESMRLNTQKELAGATLAVDVHKHHAPQVATPAVEPPGRAQAGEAFQS